MSEKNPKAADAQSVGRKISDDLEFVNALLNNRLGDEDLKEMLANLSSDSGDGLAEKVVSVLGKTSSILEFSRRGAESQVLDVLLPQMVSMVSEFLDAERTTIFLHDPLTTELFSWVAEGDLPSEIRIPSNVGIAGHVFTEKTPLIVDDAYNEPRFNQEVDKKTGFRTRNILCAPIPHPASGTIGVIQVLNHRDGPFTELDLKLLESISAQSATGFENARLHDQIVRAQKYEELYIDVTTTIAQELELKPLLQKIMESVTIFMDADRSTLFLYDARRDELWSQVAQGADEIRFRANLGIAGTVFTTGEVINIRDAYADERFNPEFDQKTGYRTRTILCMPVLASNSRILGVIQVLNKERGIFSPQDVQRLQAFCSQAATAIGNAKLFEEVIRIQAYNENILESMINGLLTLDSDGFIVKANKAALKLFPPEITGVMPVGMQAEFFFGYDNMWLHKVIQKVLRSGESDEVFEADLHIPNSERVATVNVTTRPLVDPGTQEQGCLVIIEDLTEEKRVRNTMARYMSKEVADKLLEDGGDAALGGSIQRATVLFSDIRKFTTISERIGPQETVRLLNDYFTIMVDILLHNRGLLDKYIGDAIMAVFGVPFPNPMDANNALVTAVDMMRALKHFNAERVRDGHEAISIGIGLNTDDVLSGNIGSSKRMDYTVIGDGVNLAARLEGATKQYGADILVSESTIQGLDRANFLIREVDRIRVKGKTEPVTVYEAMDHFDEEDFPHRDDVLEHYQEGILSYRAADWPRALKAFEQAIGLNPGDKLCGVYRERCAFFLDSPPDDDWDGVWTLEAK